MFGLRLSATFVLMTLPGNAQGVLRAFQEIAAPGVANALTMDATRCDPQGNIYLRIADAPDVTKQLLTRIGRDGGTASYNAEKVIDVAIEPLSLGDFAVTSDAVWLLATARHNESYILRFTLQGDYKGALKVDADFHPEQLAVFDTGDLLLSGIERVGHQGEEGSRAVTAMFDKNGRFLKRIELDEEGKDEKQHPQPRDVYGEVPASITLGTAESYGGEIYVLRASASPSILVISSAGTLARRITLEPPSRDAKVTEMRVAQGQIVVEFVRPKTAVPQVGGAVFYEMSSGVYAVYDAFHGNKIAEYTRDPGLAGSFACFDPQRGFEFLSTTKNGTRAIIRASVN